MLRELSTCLKLVALPLLVMTDLIIVLELMTSILELQASLSIVLLLELPVLKLLTLSQGICLFETLEIGTFLVGFLSV